MKKVLLVLTLSIIKLGYADSAVLNNFLSQVTTMQAHFTQSVTTNKKTQVTYGIMEISRPNKFRWNYSENEQLIVSNGKNIYIYDKPLEQVTIKPLASSLDKSPAALLAGANDINNLYLVTESNINNNGIKWVRITPRRIQDNNGFIVVLLGFNSKNELSQMKFTDSFGNDTLLEFSQIKLGAKISEKEFEFIPPKGIDIVY